MPSYPDRCQHIKVNGTQCGSPALRRNRFCYFHKRHHEERVALHLDHLKQERARGARRRITIDLPVLEDANAIQVSLMQIMRLLLSGQLEGKTAGLLLYSLQIASSNLPRTRFEPNIHQVVLDPGGVADNPLKTRIWEDEDFDNQENDDPEEGDQKPAHDSSQPSLPPKRPAARLAEDCVITVSGKKILQGLPLKTREEAVRALNRSPDDR